MILSEFINTGVANLFPKPHKEGIEWRESKREIQKLNRQHWKFNSIGQIRGLRSLQSGELLSLVELKAWHNKERIYLKYYACLRSGQSVDINESQHYPLHDSSLVDHFWHHLTLESFSVAAVVEIIPSERGHLIWIQKDLQLQRHKTFIYIYSRLPPYMLSCSRCVSQSTKPFLRLKAVARVSIRVTVTLTVGVRNDASTQRRV